jgi:NADH:ubiquinone oxidoreductase subunit 3 (subunit A)
MKFDEIRDSLNEIKAPEIDEDSFKNQTKETSIKKIVNCVRKMDRKAKFCLIGLQVVFSLWVVWLVFSIINEGVLLRQMGFATIIVGFFLGIYYKQLQLEKYHATDFDSSITDYLKRAKARLAFSLMWHIYAIIWLLFDVGLCFLAATYYHRSPFTLFQCILLIQFALVLGIAFELAIAYSQWKRTRKPVIDEIDNMLNEINDPH